MDVDLPPDTQNRLAEHARAVGYDDVSRYVSEQLQAIARQPTPTELSPLSDDELARSRAMIEEGESDLAAGRTRDLREALLEIGERFGFRANE